MDRGEHRATTATVMDEVEADLDQALDTARRFAARLRERFGKQVLTIRLFGSAARGDWTGESDVDVLVLLESLSGDDADEISRLAFHLGVVESGVLLRPLALDVSRFEALRQRERRIALDIEREGVDL